MLGGSIGREASTPRTCSVLFLVCVLAGACADHRTGDAGTDATIHSAHEAGPADSGHEAGPADSGNDANVRDASLPSTIDGLWSHMGYDQRNQYFNPEETTLSLENAASLVEKWRFETKGMPTGTPIVAESKVFVLASGGMVAIHLASGKLAWELESVHGTASLAYDSGFIYAHAGDAKLYKLDAATGAIVWGPVVTNSVKGCSGISSPVVAGDKVLVGRECGAIEITFDPGGVSGGVAAFFTRDGSAAWEYRTTTGDEDGAAVWSTVSVDFDAGVVYATSGNNYTMAGPGSDAFHAIDLATGERLWTAQMRTNDVWSFAALGGEDADIGANPILIDIGKKRLIAAGDKGSKFSVLDRRTGAVQWSREMLSATRDNAHGGKLMNGAFDGNRLYAIFNDPFNNKSVLRAFDVLTGKDAWPAKEYPTLVWGAPSLANGLLVAPINSEIHILNAETGASLKVFETGGTIAGGAPAIAGGRIVVGSGLFYMLGGSSVLPNQEVICYGLP